MPALREIDWAAVATFLAVLAALSVPYLSANLERRRRAQAALQLSELALQAIDPLGGVDPACAADQWRRAAFELRLAPILEAMSRVPPDHICATQALDAFIRLQGLGRSLIEMEKRGEGLSVDDAAHYLTDAPVVRQYAAEQVARLRELLR